jgi:hypothetical protein
MRAHAAAVLADVETRPVSAEVGVAHRVQGVTHWFAGEFLEAQQHLESAVALFQPERDDDLSFRLVQGAAASMAYFTQRDILAFGAMDAAVVRTDER